MSFSVVESSSAGRVSAARRGASEGVGGLN